MRKRRSLLMIMTFVIALSMVTVNVAAVTWTRSSIIRCWDNFGDFDSVSFVIYGEHVDDPYIGKYFRAAEHRVIITRIAEYHTISNVVLRGFTESYDITVTRTSVSSGDIISFSRSRLRTSGIGSTLDFDVRIPTKIVIPWPYRPYYKVIITGYTTHHIHVYLELDPYYQPVGPTILDFP